MLYMCIETGLHVVWCKTSSQALTLFSPVHEAAPAEWQGVLLRRGACHLHYGLSGHTLLAETRAPLRADGHQSVLHHQVVLETLTVTLVCVCVCVHNSGVGEEKERKRGLYYSNSEVLFCSNSACYDLPPSPSLPPPPFSLPPLSLPLTLSLSLPLLSLSDSLQNATL